MSDSIASCAVLYGTIGALISAALIKLKQDRAATPEITVLTDLTVLSLEGGCLRSFRDASGWSYYETDLNKGTSGKYLYAGYKQGKTGEAAPITKVDFRAFDSKQTSAPEGWSWSPVDLNAGTGGKFIYLLWQTGGEEPPITNLRFTSGDKLDVPPTLPRYTQVGCNLNEGNKGHYIWAYYSNTEQPQPV
jgi:hypothetical protein